MNVLFLMSAFTVNHGLLTIGLSDAAPATGGMNYGMRTVRYGDLTEAAVSTLPAPRQIAPFRRERRVAAIPASPAPSSTIEAGSGMLVPPGACVAVLVNTNWRSA